MKGQVLPYTVLLAIGQGKPPRVVNQATGMLLCTGNAEMLVTCGHVYDKFVGLRESDPTTRLAMSGAEGKDFIDISPAIVLGRAIDPDLATLAFHGPMLTELARAWRFTRWPLPRAKRGMIGI